MEIYIKAMVVLFVVVWVDLYVQERRELRVARAKMKGKRMI